MIRRFLSRADNGHSRAICFETKWPSQLKRLVSDLSMNRSWKIITNSRARSGSNAHLAGDARLSLITHKIRWPIQIVVNVTRFPASSVHSTSQGPVISSVGTPRTSFYRLSERYSASKLICKLIRAYALPRTLGGHFVLFYFLRGSTPCQASRLRSDVD